MNKMATFTNTIEIAVGFHRSVVKSLNGFLKICDPRSLCSPFASSTSATSLL